jgi:hypothetical protein
MGLGGPSGANLGAAVGSISINTTQAQQAPAVMRQVAQGINAAMGSVSGGVNKAQTNINSLRGSLGQLAGAFGLSLGVAGVAQITQAAIGAAQAATAYDRQALAARSLAGSQQKLNELLAAYEKATQGAVDQATALSDVTNLQAIGFAKNAQEMQRFVIAARGISIAKGRPQGEMINELALSIANQSTRRFDQLGLGIAEVNQRISELRENNKGMTREMAFQEAVLQIATEKYGELATGAAGQKTGIEALTKSWSKYGLALGHLLQGPLDAVGKFLAKGFDAETKRMEAWLASLKQVEEVLRRIGVLGKDLSGISSRTSIGRVTPEAFGATPEIEGAKAVRLEWAKGVQSINEQMHADIISEETNFGRQRSSTISSYNRDMMQEARDFGIQRTRAEQEMLESIADLHSDAARREKRMAEDLARSIARAQGDSAERIADMREDTNDRLAELDEDYQEDRKKSAEKFKDDLLSAAGRLDAVALLELRKDRRRELEERKDSYDEQRSDLQEQLAKRIVEENEALDKSTRLQQEAHDRQLEDARQADAERLADMQADFAKRKEQEDADRATRLADRAADHAEQVAEMDRAHIERMNDIKRQAAEARSQQRIDAQEALLELGVQNEAWQKAMDAREQALEKMWDKFMGHVEASFGPMQGPQARPGFDSLLNPPAFLAPGTAGASSAGGRNISVGAISVTIAGAPNLSTDAWRGLIREEIVNALEEVAD